MYRPPTADMRRGPPASPSRFAHANLSIRTSQLQQSQPQAHSSPAAPPSATSSMPDVNPTYPIPIPDEKLEKALKLYKALKDARREERFAQIQQSATSSHHGFHLDVPLTPAPRSATSRTSSRRGRAVSVSTATYEEITDLSSVMSFDESPSSAKVKAELSTFDGKKVIQRKRKRFPKADKVKTALIRHLGSCSVCSRRRVPCELEAHHDVQRLERILEARSQRPRTYSQSHSRPFVPPMLDPNRRSVSDGQVPMGNAIGNVQTDIMGLGQNPALLQTSVPLATTLDIQSPANDDAASDILSCVPLPYDQSNLTTPSSNFYSSYQNGDMFPIGIQCGPGAIFSCSHFPEYCFQMFNNIEDLQLHFETAHFAFTRISPAHRFVCSSCQTINDFPSAPCNSCGTQGQTEVWIYGNYIRNPSFHRLAPDGQDSQGSMQDFAPYYNSSFHTSNSSFANSQEFNGDGNQGGLNFQHGGNSQFGGGGPSQGYTYQNTNMYNGTSPNGTQFQGNQFQGSQFQRARQIMGLKTQYYQSRTIRQRKILFSLILCFSLAAMLFFPYNWTISKLRVLVSSNTIGYKPSISILGFVGMVASSVMYLSVKRFNVPRARARVRTIQRCPFHAISKPMRILGCKVNAPDTYVRGGIYS